MPPEKKRRASRRNFAGLLITLALHGAVLFAVARRAQQDRSRRFIMPRDFVVAKMVKLGKPREKFWLPRITQPPRPTAPPDVIKLSEDPNAKAAPNEAPRPDNPKISKDLRRALDRARKLEQLGPDEPEEGQLTGSKPGTANQRPATRTRRRSSTPPQELQLPGGLTIDQLEPAPRSPIHIRADGTILENRLLKPSGNSFFDDACVDAAKLTGKVPPPPPPRAVAMRVQSDKMTLRLGRHASSRRASPSRSSRWLGGAVAARRARSRPAATRTCPRCISPAPASSSPAGAARAEGDAGDRRRARDRGPGHLGHLPAARPGLVPRRSAERGDGVLVGALVAGRRAGGRQDQGLRAARSRGRALRVGRGDGAGAVAHLQGSDVRDAVHQFANDVVKAFTGQPGVFGSRIAVALTGKRARDRRHGHGRRAHDRSSPRWAPTACCRRSRRAAARSRSRRTCAATPTSRSCRRAAGARAACRSSPA